MLLIRNGLLVTADTRSRVFQGDILIDGNRIKDIQPKIDVSNDTVIIDASEYVVTPGFVQTHVHLCQSLYRNCADDLLLLDWLRKRIWPYEASLTRDNLRLAAQLGLTELLLGGTTTIMDMGTVKHMDVVFEELVRSGIRAYCGKTMMDYGEMPPELFEDMDTALNSSLELLQRWHNAENGRIRYAFAPRFAVSCTEELLKQTKKLADEHGVIFHTHASENQGELALVKKRFGRRNISYLNQIGVTGENICLAHCIWLDEVEKDILRSEKMHVLHCPGSNLKLGSGIAPIPEYLEKGINVSLGADGAPCNNNLDIFNEMRLAALIQKPIHGPQSMDAETVFRMATIEGAHALGLEKETGSLETGKKADLCLLKLNQVSSIPYDNIFSKIVYSMRSDSVEHVMIDGNWVVQNRKPVHYDLQKIIENTTIFTENCLN